LGQFERLVAHHGSDRRIRRMSTKDQLVALLYGQLSGATSLREIAGGLASHANRVYHLGARPVQRSTLGDANAKRPAALFATCSPPSSPRPTGPCAARWPRPST
jgi:hypothetical protein